MENMIKKILVTSAFSLAVALPSLASTTQLSLSGSVDDVLVIQIERVSDSKVVSGDDFQRNGNDPMADEVLTFGTIDARGMSEGNVQSALSTNLITPDSGLQRVVLDNSSPQNIFDPATPPVTAAGAIYYIKGGYQIRTVRSPGPLGEIITDVDVDTTGDIKSYVDLAETNTMTSGSSVSAGSIKGLIAPATLLKEDVANNDPFTIDVGLYVETTTPAGVRSTVMTFTGT